MEKSLEKKLQIKLAFFGVLIAILFFLSGCKKVADSTEDDSKGLEKVNWKIAQTWGVNLAILNEPSEYVAKMVSQMSDGNFTIQIDHAEKHGNPLGVFDLVKLGEYEMAHSASYYWKVKVPNTLYFTTMPFGMTAIEQYAWFYHGGGVELMSEVYAPHGLLSFPGGNTGEQMGGWFTKKINSLDDFKGLKMRIPGFAGEILAGIGASVVKLSADELFPALEKGSIDALEWVGPSLDFTMGFHRVAKYYYTGWHEPATELQFMVNQAAFEALPNEYQTMLTTAMKSAAYNMYYQSLHESAVNWKRMKAEILDVEVLTFPKSVLEALRFANDKLLAKCAQDDPQAAKIINSRLNYLKRIRTWTNLSELAYTKSVTN